MKTVGTPYRAYIDGYTFDKNTGNCVNKVVDVSILLCPSEYTMNNGTCTKNVQGVTQAFCSNEYYVTASPSTSGIFSDTFIIS